MEKRQLGRTGHMSSIVTFGGFAVGFDITQKEADAAIEAALEAGVNHVDVAPSYGQAEARLGSYFQRHGNPFFLNCKTTQRTGRGARESLEKSLNLLQVDHCDLFQFHGVKNHIELNTILGPDGAMEAVLEAKKQGLVRFIGITGHHPMLFNEAIGRFEFDTVMFPLNRVHAAHFVGWNDWRPLLKTARKKNMGVFAIKSVAKRVWPEGEEVAHRYNTWYEPFEEADDIEKCIRYTLSQDITTAVLPGELKLWPMIFKAAENFEKMDLKEQKRAIAEVSEYPPLFAEFMELSNW
jgi:predicted aldo/keto reductase-like oxidoreductase